MGKSKENENQKDNTNNVQPDSISQPKLIYSKEGAVRDVSKVGYAASDVKTISDEQEATLSGSELI